MENTYTKKTVIAIGATTLLHVTILLFLLARLLLDQTADEKKFPLDMPDIPENWAQREAPIRFVDLNDSQEEHPNKNGELESSPAHPILASEITTPVSEIESDQQEIPKESEEEITEQQFPLEETKTHGTATIVENKPEPVKKSSVEKAPIPKEKKVIAQKPTPQTKKKQLKLSDLADLYKMRMNQQAPIGDFFMQGNPHNLPPDQQIIFERYRNKLSTIIEQVKKENPIPCAVPLGVLVKIYLSLSQNGRFKELKITHSTGYESIDNYCMTIYKIASERFPPIPSCLQESMFKGTITLQSTQNPQAGGWFCFN